MYIHFSTCEQGPYIHMTLLALYNYHIIVIIIISSSSIFIISSSSNSRSGISVIIMACFATQ